MKVSIKKRPKTEVEGEDGDEIKKLSGLGAWGECGTLKLEGGSKKKISERTNSGTNFWNEFKCLERNPTSVPVGVREPHCL